MTDIKKINIYMGVVGQAYVDKETASKNLEAALKNIQDVEEIITLATNYLEAANNSLTRANEALEFARRIREELEYKRTQVAGDSPVYQQLSNLINELNSNDYDGNALNGGSENTANNNINNINEIINELNNIKSTAETLLVENTSYKDQCQLKFNTAKATFESYIPTEEESQADKSDQLEAELLERLNNAATGIEVANQITDAINEVSNHFQNESNNINIDDQPGGDQPGGGDQPSNDYYFYVGTEKPTSLSQASVVNSYEAEYIYTNNSGAKSHIFVLTNNGKIVEFINLELNAPVSQNDVDTTTIPGYKIFETAVGLANTASIKIIIS